MLLLGSSPASDLWAIGCILYQMVSGMPPFQSASEYLIFQKIQRLEYSFHEGFHPEVRIPRSGHQISGTKIRSFLYPFSGFLISRIFVWWISGKISMWCMSNVDTDLYCAV